jgi:hypothetical protein
VGFMVVSAALLSKRPFDCRRQTLLLRPELSSGDISDNICQTAADNR